MSTQLDMLDNRRRRKIRRAPPPLEAAEQTALFQWAAIEEKRRPELRMLLHIPNGGTRFAREARALKERGVKPGVPDICLPVPSGEWHSLWIELKRLRGSRASPEQMHWVDMLTAAGNLVVICRGWEEAREQILEYLALGREDAL